MGIISKLFEKRAHPSNPANWMLYGLEGSGRQSTSGVVVTPDSAMEFPAVWSAVTQLSQNIASLPLNLYKKLDRGREVVNNDPRQILLKTKPNPEMTAFSFREAMMANVLLYGYFGAEIKRDFRGRPVELWPLLSTNLKMKRVDGELVFLYALPDGTPKVFSKENVLFISGFSKDGISGIAGIEKGKDAVGLGKGLEDYAAKFFANGAKPSAILQHPASLSREAQERLIQAWSDRHQGLSNAHRVAILEEGMQLKEYGIDPEKAQALEARKFSVTEVARLFNMPPHMLKDLERASFNNIEMMSLEFVMYTLRPWLVRLEQDYGTQLLTDNELKRFFFSHKVDGLLRGDIKTRNEAYAMGRQWGYLSANDCREMENLNPIDGGDTYLVPQNMFPADQLDKMVDAQTQGNATNSPDEGGKGSKDSSDSSDDSNNNSRGLHSGDVEVRASKEFNEERFITKLKQIRTTFGPLIRSAAQEVVNKETRAVSRIAKKTLNERSNTDFENSITEFYATHKDYIETKLGPVLRAMQISTLDLLNELMPDVKVDRTSVDEFMQAVVAYNATVHVISSQRQLTNVLDTSELSKALDDVVTRCDEWFDKRAQKIEMSETVRVPNAITREVFQKKGVKKLRWRTIGTSCPFCNTLAGKVVGIKEAFLDAGDEIKVEGRTPLKMSGKRLNAPIHSGCDCTVVPEL